MLLVLSVNTTHLDLESRKVIPRDSMVPIPVLTGLPVPIPLKVGILISVPTGSGSGSGKNWDRNSPAEPYLMHSKNLGIPLNVCPGEEHR